MFFKCCFLVLWSALVLAAQLPALPSYAAVGDCRSNDDCGSSSCCLIGMMRYSTPWCAPLLKLGDTCRPSSTQLKNVTLTYPGGLEIFLKDAYQVLCPCDASQGLVCSPINGTCIVDFQIATNDIVR